MKTAILALLCVLLTACGGGDPEPEATSCVPAQQEAFSTACPVTFTIPAGAGAEVVIDGEVTVANASAQAMPYRRVLSLSIGGDGYSLTYIEGTAQPGATVSIPFRLRQLVTREMFPAGPEVTAGLSSIDLMLDTPTKVRDVSVSVR